jgi:DNA mismatch endonuclease (patch repair protein)
MDHVSPKKRSAIMASVKGRGNTTTELPMEKLIRAARLWGYRKHLPLPGRPDFSWPRKKVAVFVDGCFWHGCRCKYLPRSNRSFWRAKLIANKARDKRVAQSLRRRGWKVLRIKECAVKRGSAIKRIARAVAPTYAELKTPVRGQ